MEKQTIKCCNCHKDKPVEEGCFIAISVNSDRCKECQDYLQENGTFPTETTLKEMNELANELI